MAEVITVRDHDTGRIEFEIMGLTPFAEVPESPYYVPSPGSRRAYRAWVDEDGKHVVLAHDCRDGRDVHILRWPTWQVVDGPGGQEVSPSFDCGGCGVHTFVFINANEEPTTAAQDNATPVAATRETTSAANVAGNEE